MDDTPQDHPRSRADLTAALRTARAEDAERSQVLTDLRTLQLARLDLLRDALAPVLAQIPESIDLFDVGLMPGDPPRLFIDMIAFVEMSRDRRGYCFFQDRRHGRVLLGEADTLDGAIDLITAYIARRLIERDKALASDVALPPFEVRKPASRLEAVEAPAPLRWNWAAQSFWFVVETLGLLVLFGLALFGLRWVLMTMHVPWF